MPNYKKLKHQSMPTNNNHNVSDKELDNLLSQAFLNLDFNQPKNQELMETISNQVLPINMVSVGLFNKSIITKLISIIFLIGIPTIIYFTYFKTQSVTQSFNTESKPVISMIEPTFVSEPIKMVSNSNVSVADKKNIVSVNTVSVNLEQDVNSLNEYPKHQEQNTAYFPIEKKVKQEDSNYIFPTLTEKEIKANEKQKARIINWLAKKSKDKYALITPIAGHSLLSSIADTTAMFYIQNAEVSNLEYRTFLFDLLIQDRKQEFLIAKPNQRLWLNTLGITKYNYLKDLYFSDKRFNDYPVVNVSPKGAELYCKWLSELPLKNQSSIIARLPYENEWEFAAHGGFKGVYPWPRDSIQNKLGCYLANFCVKKRSNQLQTTNIKCDPKKHSNAHTSGGIMLGDSVLSVYTYAYNPNDYGIYCMTGNVSEMVYDNKTKTIKSKGGSWDSDFEQCKIAAVNDEVAKTSSTIGFRPIFRINTQKDFGSIDRDDTKTGLTVLTAEETANALKEKKKMIDAVVKLNKDKYAQIPMGSCVYKKDTISVQSFYMETTEVTNLEYRTFLADLLIQNRTADYLLAKLNQEMWITKFPWSFNDPMANMYFWHPAYDEYPVVNISRKGAELYCLWLTIEANKYLKENNKPLMNDLRIATDHEWAYAACSKANHSNYATGHQYLRDSKGKYEMNYMCASKEQCRFDTVMKLYIPKEKGTSYVDDGAFHTAFGKSYSANAYGLYCLAGNAAEMVNTYDKKINTWLKKGTKGGSWFSCDYFLEIDADEEYIDTENPSPLIGFRPVFTAKSAK